MILFTFLHNRNETGANRYGLKVVIIANPYLYQPSHGL